MALTGPDHAPAVHHTGRAATPAVPAAPVALTVPAGGARSRATPGAPAAAHDETGESA